MLLVLIGIIRGVQCLRGKHTLVQVDYLIAIIFKLVNPLLHIKSPLLILFFFFYLDFLGELDPFALDSMIAVYLTKQCRIDAMVAKLPMEKHTSPLE